MRKSIRSRSKRKWIVGGALVFGGVALLTTGFATWIVGLQITESTNTVGISVDTATNNSVSIATELDPADRDVFLRETITSTNATDIVVNDSAQPADLQFTFKNITIQVGKQYWEQHYAEANVAKNFELAIDFDKDYVLTTEEAAKYKNVTGGNFIDDTSDLIGKRSGTDYTYVDVKTKTIAVDVESGADHWEDKGTYYELTLVSKTIELQWGSFYNNKGPAEFYNELNADKSLSSVEMINNITSEFNALYEAFSYDESTTPEGAILAISVTLGTAR